MARRFQRFGEPGASTTGEINISPLIDIVFILLIFFIVTTVFVEETGIEVEKPRAATQTDIQKNSILIGITSAGQVFYAGREIGTAGVRSTIGRLVQQDDLPVIIQADRETPTETTVQVFDEAKLAGAARVFISTVNE